MKRMQEANSLFIDDTLLQEVYNKYGTVDSECKIKTEFKNVSFIFSTKEVIYKKGNYETYFHLTGKYKTDYSIQINFINVYTAAGDENLYVSEEFKFTYNFEEKEFTIMQYSY